MSYTQAAIQLSEKESNIHNKKVETSLKRNVNNALYARHYLRNMYTMCIGCGIVFKPYVDFPLYYKFSKCTVCLPGQNLVRCPYEKIPAKFTCKDFNDAIKSLHKKKYIYPPFMKIFEELNEILKAKGITVHETKSKVVIQSNPVTAPVVPTSTAIVFTNQPTQSAQSTQSVQAQSTQVQAQTKVPVNEIN